MALISDGRLVQDEWRHVSDEEALPAAGRLVVSQGRIDEAATTLPPETSFGVIVPNTADPAALANYFPRLALISIAFPAFADGRGFSLARLLRRAGFKGELRASGRLLADQYVHALGCGFDTVEIPADLAKRQDETQWRNALDAYSAGYQRGYDLRGSILQERRKASK